MSPADEVPISPLQTPKTGALPDGAVKRSRGRALPVFGVGTSVGVTPTTRVNSAVSAPPVTAQRAAPEVRVPDRHTVPVETALPDQAAPETEVVRRHLSIVAMIIGIVSLVLSVVFLSSLDLGLLPEIAAVIVGHWARKRQPWAKPLWLTGLITGYIAVGIGACWIALVIYVVTVLY